MFTQNLALASQWTAMQMIEIPYQAEQMDNRRTEHRNMHDLMAATKDVEDPSPVALGELGRVDDRACCVEC